MEAGIFDEYLVKLGFDSDPAGFAKFKATLLDAAGIAEKSTTSIISDLAKWQGAILGGFAAIGTAALGIADKIADADLGYQLLATKMFIGADAAKSLSIATDVLGHSLDEIARNPELLSSFGHFIEDQKRLKAVLGTGAEASAESSLKHIRAIHWELNYLGEELENYIGPLVIDQVSKAFGGEDILTRLQKFQTWVTEHAPEITSTFAQYIIPILKDVKHVGDDVVDVAEHIGSAFIHIVGAINGDDSLSGGKLTVENFGKAIDEVADDMVSFTDAVTSAVDEVLDLITAMVQLATLHPIEAIRSLQKAGHDSTPGGNTVLGFSALSAVGTAGAAAAAVKIGSRLLGGAAAGGAATGEAAAAGGAAGGAVLAPLLGIFAAASLADWIDKTHPIAPNSWGAKELSWENKFAPLRWINSLRDDGTPSSPSNTTPATPSGVTSKSDLHALIDKVSAQYGINPILAHAVAGHESNESQYDAKGKLKVGDAGDTGVFQLIPSTAREYGVDASDTGQNVDGGIRLLRDLGKHYHGNIEEVLAAYNWGSGRVDDLIKKHGRFDASYLQPKQRDYIKDVEERMRTIQITNNIYPSPNHSEKEIAKQVTDQTEAALRANSRRQNMSNIAKLGSPYQ